jgi:hypothetical protein
MQSQQVPLVGVRSYIASLAKRYGVSCVRTGSDALADVISHLADDEITTDETEDMIVALRRANVIDGPTTVLLLGRYLDEKRHV